MRPVEAAVRRWPCEGVDHAKPGALRSRPFVSYFTASSPALARVSRPVSPTLLARRTVSFFLVGWNATSPFVGGGAIDAESACEGSHSAHSGDCLLQPVRHDRLLPEPRRHCLPCLHAVGPSLFTRAGPTPTDVVLASRAPVWCDGSGDGPAPLLLCGWPR